MVFILVDRQHVKAPFLLQWVTVVAQAGIKVICHGKITDLSDLVNSYISAERRPGICLLINNAPNLEVQEKKLKDLFEFLSFNVKIERHVSKTEFFNLADQFAKKNFTHFDAFVVILMSVSGKLTKISCAEGRNISIEDVMQEFNASRFRSLRGKPKLFFVQCFKKPYSRVNPTGRVLRGTDTVSCPCFCTSEEDSCPKEADFLLICVKSTNPESLFIQVKDRSSFFTGGGGRGRALENFGGNHKVFRGKRWGLVVAKKIMGDYWKLTANRGKEVIRMLQGYRWVLLCHNQNPPSPPSPCGGKKWRESWKEGNEAWRNIHQTQSSKTDISRSSDQRRHCVAH